MGRARVLEQRYAEKPEVFATLVERYVHTAIKGKSCTTDPCSLGPGDHWAIHDLTIPRGLAPLVGTSR